LAEISGLGKKRQQQIIEAWSEQKGVREIMVFLQSHGIGPTRAVRIYKTYGDRAVDKIMANPYRLALDIQGVGFKIADALALSIGVSSHDPMRASAGVRHVMQDFASQGHCAVPHDTLVERAVKLLEIPAEIISQGVDQEVTEGRLVAELIDDQRCYFLAALQRAEVYVAKRLLRLMQGEALVESMEVDKVLKSIERQTGMELSASQHQAIETVLGAKVSVITGGPGVGKTTVVNSLLQVVRIRGLRVLLCAPTGRAAKRLAESTGSEAKTIHRLLEFDPASRGFKRNGESPLETDLVIVDEMSMVDISLMHSLLSALPDSAGLLMVGDVDQLPSVGPGAVLADVIKSGRIATARLTEIFRQAASSKIIVNAHRINHGELPAQDESRDGRGRATQEAKADESRDGRGRATQDAKAEESRDGRGRATQEAKADEARDGRGRATQDAKADAHMDVRGRATQDAKAEELGEQLSDFYFIASETPEDIHAKVIQLVKERIPKRFNLHPIKEIQVLSPMNKGGLGTKSLNIELQKVLNPSTGDTVSRFGFTYAVNDKVIQTVNNYDKEVFNGDIGFVEYINSEEGIVKLNFEGRSIDYKFDELEEVSLAYATTIHKAQGSEYPAVVIPLATQHYTLLQRNLIYTGVTRGRQLVVIIGQPKALRIAVDTVSSKQRLTKLAQRLMTG
jgi:exodeoxyribonuclease V alpha subunit